MLRKMAFALSAVVGGCVLVASCTSQQEYRQDHLNTVVTDGESQFAEGVLDGYFLQTADGTTMCENPYAIGKYVSCQPTVTIKGRTYRAPAKKVWVETNGQLGGMDVVDARGRVICTGPVASNMFRGPDSYLICP